MFAMGSFAARPKASFFALSSALPCGSISSKTSPPFFLRVVSVLRLRLLFHARCSFSCSKILFVSPARPLKLSVMAFFLLRFSGGSAASAPRLLNPSATQFRDVQSLSASYHNGDKSRRGTMDSRLIFAGYSSLKRALHERDGFGVTRQACAFECLDLILRSVKQLDSVSAAQPSVFVFFSLKLITAGLVTNRQVFGA